jgi:muramoyltetrapeptide carboxypeptidase
MAAPSLRSASAAPPPSRIRLVAPASPFDATALDAGRTALLSLGFRVSAPPDLSHADRYLAAPDAQRAAELLNALTAPDVDAVMAARGGYGVTRLLPLLSQQLPRLREAPPRLVAGFSDITALHLFLWGTVGWRSLHGPVCTSLAHEPEHSRLHFVDMMSGRGVGARLTGEGWGSPAVVEGRLCGGNLAVLMALVGTPWWPDLRGAVLLLEDVDERPHRLDRMLTQLMAVTDGLRGVAGVALGHFTRCNDDQKGHRGLDTLRSVLGGAPFPVVAGLPVGHEAPNLALPHGAMVQLDGAGSLTVLEPCAVAQVGHA